MTGLADTVQVNSAKGGHLMGSVELFDEIATYVSGEGIAPRVPGLTGDGAEFFATEHGQAQAAKWVKTARNARDSVGMVAITGASEAVVSGLLSKPFARLTELLNRKGAQYARQRSRVSED